MGIRFRQSTLSHLWSCLAEIFSLCHDEEQNVVSGGDMHNHIIVKDTLLNGYNREKQLTVIAVPLL